MSESDLLIRWLETLVQRGGSDLFLVAGLPPAVRINGKILHLEEQPLEPSDIENVVLPALAVHAVQQYRTQGSTDFSLRYQGLGRFRINLHHERGRPAAAIRALPPRRLVSPSWDYLRIFWR